MHCDYCRQGIACVYRLNIALLNLCVYRFCRFMLQTVVCVTALLVLHMPLTNLMLGGTARLNCSLSGARFVKRSCGGLEAAEQQPCCEHGVCRVAVYAAKRVCAALDACTNLCVSVDAARALRPKGRFADCVCVPHVGAA